MSFAVTAPDTYRDQFGTFHLSCSFAFCPWDFLSLLGSCSLILPLIDKHLTTVVLCPCKLPLCLVGWQELEVYRTAEWSILISSTNCCRTPNEEIMDQKKGKSISRLGKQRLGKFNCFITNIPKNHSHTVWSSF